ncbi:MAG TPA: thioredoxin-dependent thiol peroxidase [Clostridiales bacterium]|nr:thioredoxin-dependent thiol peroxidase [Clostridiales bacterium]
MLKSGDKAPDISLLDQNAKPTRLSDFKGQKVVLYFYPRDNTAGCTRQAVAFKETYADLQDQGVVLLGVSKDSVASHQKFAAKNSLPFPLLADTELSAIKAYDVWQEKKMYGKTAMGVVRTTYIIDENGVIEKVYEKVKPDGHATDVLAYLMR